MNESTPPPAVEPKKRGRPPLTEGKLSVRYILKMLPEDRARLEALGGAVWLRRQIRKAKLK